MENKIVNIRYSNGSQAAISKVRYEMDRFLYGVAEEWVRTENPSIYYRVISETQTHKRKRVIYESK